MFVISAIQFCPRLSSNKLDVLDNFQRLKPLICQAARMKTKFLVLPELCMTGYSFLSKDDAKAVAEKRDGPTFIRMRTIARLLSSYVSWGYIRISDSGCLYNSATMVNPLGYPIAWYDKINLWGNDYLWASPGLAAAPIVETEFGKTSLIICRDLRGKIPKNTPRMAGVSDDYFGGESVDLVAACTNWGKGGFPANSWMDFVVDNQCTLVVANRWGSESLRDFTQDFGHGGSAIIKKDLSVHTSGLKFSSDCVVTAVIT